MTSSLAVTASDVGGISKNVAASRTPRLHFELTIPFGRNDRIFRGTARTSAFNNLICHRTENPSRFSAASIDSHDWQGLVVGRINRASAVWQVDVVLGQQRFVDRDVPPMASKGEGAHVGDH
jgi:hypothetical protein